MFALSASIGRLSHVHTIAGDVSVSPSEYGSAQSRHAQPGTVSAVHEAAAVWPLPVAPRARAHLPRRQAGDFRGE